MKNSPLRMMAMLAGGHADDSPVAIEARPRFALLGVVLLATAGIAALSAGFASRMALGVSLPVAVAIGVGWGLVIFALDRALVSGMATQPSWKANVAAVVPRVVLALIVGTVISTPLTLQIFHKEINTEIRAIQREASAEFAKDLAADDRFVLLPDLQRQVAYAMATNEGGQNPVTGVGAGQANTDLAKNLGQLEGLRDGLQRDFDAHNDDDTGLLIRLQALHRLGDRSALVGWAHALIWTMFTCIGLMPLVVKLLMNISTPQDPVKG